MLPGECEHKARYPSRRKARRAATTIATRNGDRRMRWYLCPACHCWHLSSNAHRTY